MRSTISGVCRALVSNGFRPAYCGYSFHFLGKPVNTHFIIFSATNLAFRFSLVILLAWDLLLGEGISQESTSKGGELNPRMKQDIKAFQQALIQDSVTGSNIVIVSGADGVIYESIVNSGKDGDRDVTNETLFPPLVDDEASYHRGNANAARESAF